MKECNQCGKCCIKYSDGGLSATEQEVEMWALFRPDIHTYVKHGEIWHNPSTGEPLTRCPFLITLSPANGKAKYGCKIYADRPEDCRLYPSNLEEMIRDECEMIETKDLTQPKQAQKQLNIIMSDSHSS